MVARVLTPSLVPPRIESFAVTARRGGRYATATATWQPATDHQARARWETRFAREARGLSGNSLRCSLPMGVST